ncbi:MAG: bifunctional [glutamate--ammonia ligase]-adenylyl-L-tyrosine phosphorylase/[glutamate--ammonia-ligase] adenylyltransferase [Dokdonella sp.]|uniref:bifunctional [glutamate--ammonia ligase]-adenylyl-L-tyrosine phosphorylase/[glutamate--ammonia-ligase] adenylyltransferase n=1 Tax=Dokdonella sp. TaxID=2291710 RepID=UPI0025C04C87|nr:bifunctional [glutamate--ammonia ligase]-adenylyl-L-tyrosine phosphorylase/[glutamate--ammonia-ligase] adenylyltransferase [Dokdonella sp.]MBZ0223462.1 bifunctional [glutamate--ammonia ligase]-adenylyl-L-tyrosine phosphorylase/[glutamate--ammonia-ligase] adenylyltransferase [Dokdonella sp.]MCC7256507.1 bifunctional [glutamate--ammonia ligase]-adenylyl-L-tyrosine phosphorylase/[glutamate--ammonia-ligase] adenylyltransferase [Dokdonella sp.]
MSDLTRWPRPLVAFVTERLSRLEAACRAAAVPFHDDAGVDERLQRVLLASEFAWHSLLRDPMLLGPDGLRLMSDPRHADARAGVFAEVRDGQELRRLLRRFRLRESLRLIWRDVNGDDSVATTLTGASLLADTCIEQALRGAQLQVAQRHGVLRNAAGAEQRLVVIGMGKLGGGELNFSSDIDLILAYEEDGMSDGARPLDAAAWFARVAQAMVALLADHDADGYVYRVDLRLRPFGNAGRLALSFASMEQYYQREGRDWERYAWIKARVVAGDRIAGARLLESLRPFVYRRYLDYGAFAGLREMKGLIDAEVARKDLAGNLKLGPGGIREIEFIVQLVQLIRGGREPTLRVRGLLPALAACEQRGFLPLERARALREAYLFLRRVENRAQMFADQQTHALPDDEAASLRVAVALGFPDVAALDAELTRQRRTVADEFAALMAVEARDDVQRAQVRWAQWWRGLTGGAALDPAPLLAAGFSAPQAAIDELEALLGGVTFRNMSTRSRERLDRVMPALFAAAAAQAEPVACLVRLLRLVQAVARRSVYLALLDEQPAALKRVSAIFAASAFLAERVIAHPLLLDELFDDRVEPAPPSRAAIEDDLTRRLDALAQADAEAEIELIQEVRQSALFRIGLAFLAGHLDAVATAAALTAVAEVVLSAVLRIAERDLIASHGRFAAIAGKGSGLAIIAYGSFGGEELGFGSDLDLVFLYDADLVSGESDGARPLDASRYYARLVQRVVHLLGVLTRAGRLYEVDVRLRPDGSKGMLVLSLAAFAAYQRERAWTWELQALVRARAVAGDVALSRRFAQLRDELLALPRDAAAVRADVIEMRARWRGERDRSDAARFDLKQGSGGLVDIEFLLQGLVLIHAATKAKLRGSGNSARLIARLAECDILAAHEAQSLGAAHAYLLDRAIRCTLDGRARMVTRDADTEAHSAAAHAIIARNEMAGA